MIGRMHHVVLDCPDPDTLAAFYSAVLGLPVTYRDDDWVVVAVSDTTSGLAFQRALRVTGGRRGPIQRSRSRPTSTSWWTTSRRPGRECSRWARCGWVATASTPTPLATRSASYRALAGPRRSALPTSDARCLPAGGALPRRLGPSPGFLGLTVRPVGQQAEAEGVLPGQVGVHADLAGSGAGGHGVVVVAEGGLDRLPSASRTAGPSCRALASRLPPRTGRAWPPSAPRAAPGRGPALAACPAPGACGGQSAGRRGRWRAARPRWPVPPAARATGALLTKRSSSSRRVR